MLAAKTADPEMYVFACEVVEYLGVPLAVTVSPSEITLTFLTQDEEGAHKVMMGMLLCGCLNVCGGPLMAEEPTWEYSCKWKAHVDDIPLLYHFPSDPVLN